MATIGSLCCELYRLGLMRRLEETLAVAGFPHVAGVDEAGRGCLAGPVVAAAVIPGEGPPIPGVDDSKKLRPAGRELLASRIRSEARSWAVAAVPAPEIDATNILAATRRAAVAALGRLAPRPGAVVTDALTLPGLGVPRLAVVKGDAWCYSIACASILAKVERDRLLIQLHDRYPHYGFADHKGYGSAAHLEALARYGPSPEHRLTFGPVVPRREAA